MLVSSATFLTSHENRGCCCKGNSQNVAAEGEICTGDNISACSFYFFFASMSIFTFSKQSFNESFCNRS